MPELPPLPKSELEVARIVWNLGEATVRQVMAALPPDRELDFLTVQNPVAWMRFQERIEVPSECLLSTDDRVRQAGIPPCSVSERRRLGVALC